MAGEDSEQAVRFIRPKSTPSLQNITLAKENLSKIHTTAQSSRNATRNPQESPSAAAASQSDNAEEEEQDEKPDEDDEFSEDVENEDEYEDVDDDKEEWDEERKKFEAIKNKMRRRSKYGAITNKRILFETINYIDLEGKYHENMPLSSVLNSFKIPEHTLVLVDVNTATCRLFPTTEYREHFERLRDAPPVTPEKKMLRISWNIGESDLQYRLERAVKYLEQESRLDIILGAKKAKLVRDRSERGAMVAKIRATLAPFGFEWKTMSGGFPNAELWFQGFSKKEKASKAAELAKATIQSAPPVIDGADIPGEEKSRLSREELVAGQFKIRSKMLRSMADAEYQDVFPEKSPDAISKAYWESVGSSSNGKNDTLSPSLYEKKMEKREKRAEQKERAMKEMEKRKEKSETEEQTKARLERLEESLDSTKAGQQQEAQEHLRQIATRFAKLGSAKSMFDGKFGGGRQTKR